MEHLSSDIFKGQMERDAAGKLIYALFATVVWLFIVIGVVVIGPAILVIAFQIIYLPLRIVGFLAQRNRLRRIIAIIGFLMLTSSYAMKMMKP